MQRMQAVAFTARHNLKLKTFKCTMEELNSTNDSKKRTIDDLHPRALSGERDGCGMASLSPDNACEVKALTVFVKSLVSRVDELEKGEVSSHSHIQILDSRVNELEEEKISAQNEVRDLKSRVGILEDRLSVMGKLEKKCKSLEHRCSYLEGTVQMSVAKDGNKNTYAHQKWSSTNRNRIPALSHLREQGFDENYIESMRNFTRELRDKSIGFCSGNDYPTVVLGDYEGETVLLHDELLLENWQEFADAFRLCHWSRGHNWTVEGGHFRVSKVQLVSKVLDMLTPAMSTKHFSSVYLDNNEFVRVRDGINFVVDAMESNPLMQTISWTNNPIRSMKDANILLQGIYDHRSVKNILITNVFGDSGLGSKVLCSILENTKDLKLLNMANNQIETGGGTHISDYLATNPKLERLDLSLNNLNDEDADMIAGALEENTNLHTLKIGDNDFSHAGISRLREAIYDPTSIASVVKSNHKCALLGYELDFETYNNEREYWDYDGSNNERKKVQYFLHSKCNNGSLLYHLNTEFHEDISLKITPWLIEHFGRPHCKQPKKQMLHCIYEVVRGWQMPDLFEQKVI